MLAQSEFPQFADGSYRSLSIKDVKLVQKKSYLVNLNCSSWMTRFAIRSLELIVSKHVILPRIGHVGQSKTSEPALGRDRTDKVYVSVTRAIAVCR